MFDMERDNLKKTNSGSQRTVSG